MADVKVGFDAGEGASASFENFVDAVTATVDELHQEQAGTGAEWVLLEPVSQGFECAAWNIGDALRKAAGPAPPVSATLTYDPATYTGTFIWQSADCCAPDRRDVVAIVGQSRAALSFHFSLMSASVPGHERELASLSAADADMLVALLAGDLRGSLGPGQLSRLRDLSLPQLLRVTKAARALTQGRREAALVLAPDYVGCVDDLVQVVDAAHRLQPGRST